MQADNSTTALEERREPAMAEGVREAANFVRCARDFYGAGYDKFSPGYAQYGDLLSCAETLAAAVGGGDQEVGLREAVARIVDPMSFDNNARAYHLRPFAYAKADAILALTRPEPAKAVEGEAIPIPFDLELIDTIASYARADREQGPPCPNCDKPVEVGQVVLPWDDAGEMHADCAHPFSLKVKRGADEPEAVILLGEPMQQIPLAALQHPNTSGENA